MPRKRTFDEDEIADRKRSRNEQNRNRRRTETHEEASRRRETRNQQDRIRRASETDEQRSRRREVAATNERCLLATLREVPAPHHLDGATGSDVMNDNVQQHFCGNLQLLCTFCGAKHFPGEHPADKLFTTCCQKGKVTLDPIRISPLLRTLMTGEHEHSQNFMDNIRSINSALAFA